MLLRPLLPELLRGLVDLVYAPVCAACGSALSTHLPERLVCPGCWSRARALPLPRCPRCWHPLLPLVPRQPTGTCGLCSLLPPFVRAVRSPFLMEGSARDLVHALKYRGWRGVAQGMSAPMAAAELPLEVREEARLVVAVPLAPVRLRQRGYNQAELLARCVADRLGWECRSDLLTRARSSGSQTALHPSERRANVAGAFSVPAGGGEVLQREHVLLIDDVWTTGATALACAQALVAAGARAVSVLTFARAVPELQR